MQGYRDEKIANQIGVQIFALKIIWICNNVITNSLNYATLIRNYQSSYENTHVKSPEKDTIPYQQSHQPHTNPTLSLYLCCHSSSHFLPITLIPSPACSPLHDHRPSPQHSYNNYTTSLNLPQLSTHHIQSPCITPFHSSHSLLV